MIRSNEYYLLQTILEECSLPVTIQGKGWALTDYFTVERVEKGYAKGTYYKNGKPHQKWFGEYKFAPTLVAKIFGYAYDKEGYDENGYNKDGYDRAGYNAGGYDRHGYDRDGYDKSGYNSYGYDKEGYDAYGYSREGFDKMGYNRKGFDREGYDKAGYDKAGYNKAGYNRSGYDRDGYNKSGYNWAGYDKEGYNSSGYDRDGYDRDGYNSSGENKFSVYLYKKTGFLPEKTKLFVRSNSQWAEVLFIKFDRRNGKDIIFVRQNEIDSFYAYPSKYVADTIDEALEKKRADDTKRKNISPPSELHPSEIARAYTAFPRSSTPSINRQTEFAHELDYHSRVSGILDDRRDRAYEKIHSAYDFENKAQSALRQSYLDDRDCETGYDPFNQSYIRANLYRDTSVSLNDSATFELQKITKLREEPYFARVDCGPDSSNLHTVYLGHERISNLVVDWRNSLVGNAFYYSDMLQGSPEITIALKRRIVFKNGCLADYYDEINTHTVSDYGELSTLSRADSVFLRLLESSRKEKQVHDIVRTIQSNQYRIISSSFQKNMLINGCAGSGKTMIMYHRLAYMAYNSPNGFVPQNVYAVTPSDLFTATGNELVDRLNLQQINNCTYNDTVARIITRYQSKFKTIPFHFSLENKAPRTPNVDLLSLDACNPFLKRVKEMCNSPMLVLNQVIEIVNSILSDINIPLLQGTEIQACRQNTRTFSSLIDNRIRDYYVPLEIKRLEEQDRNKKEGKGVEEGIDKTKINIFARDLAHCSLDTLYKEAKQPNQKRLLETYAPILNSVNKKPLPQSKPSVYLVEKDFIRAVNLLYCEKLLMALDRFWKDSHNDIDGIYIFLCRFAFIDLFPDQLDTLIYHVFLLRALVAKFGSLSNEKAYFFIDEFQNYSFFELDTLKLSFSDCVFNLYGDYAQKLEGKGISPKAYELFYDGNEFEINENYRNAFEITNYINKTLGKQIRPIGLHGSVNEVKPNCIQFEIEGRTALLVKDDVDTATELFRLQSSCEYNIIRYDNMKLDAERLNIMTVADAKGMEFDTVYVWDKNMSQNEKYVAYTRALNKLIVIK